MICKMCNKEFKDLFSLSNHIKKHTINKNEYYDKYIKNENEGICLKCKNKTNFISISKGYLKYCSYNCSNSSEEVKDKKEKSYLKKYNVNNILKSKEIKDKIKLTIKEKYNVNNISKSEIVKNKKLNNSIIKYGVNHPNKRKEYSDNLKIKILPKIFKVLEKENLELLSEYKLSQSLIKVRCKKCNNIFNTRYFNLEQGYGKCSICYPKQRSISEIELANYIKSLNIEIIENDKTVLKNNKELDIYIKSSNIAIEFNGLYYHYKNTNKNKNYHLNKYLECRSKNIYLIQIFEDEWIYKKDQVKEYLKSILNNNYIDNKSFIIKNITLIEKNAFLEKYSINGIDTSDIYLGLFIDNVILSVLTLKEFNKFYKISRFCSYNINLDKSFSILLKHFKEGYKRKDIVYYLDNRFYNMDMFFRSEFEVVKNIDPIYWYINNSKRIFRFNILKYKTKKMFKIYDCGYTKLILKS